MSDSEASEPKPREEESVPEAVPGSGERPGEEPARSGDSADRPESAEVPADEVHPKPVPGATGVPGPRPARAQSLAIAATAGVVLAATAFQNLWEQTGPLIEESGQTTGIVPLVVLSGVACLVALAIVVLVARRLGRLLLSRRMTVSLLSALALVCLLSLPFEQEGQKGLRGPASRNNEFAAGEIFAPLLGEEAGKRSGEKLMILARTAGLTRIAGSWALYALVGFLVLSSVARLLWRRPVGAREFGFIAAHAGLLALLGGVACNAFFGHHQVRLRFGLDGTARPVPGGGATPAFSMVVREIVQEDLPREYRVLAWMNGEKTPERLMLDGSRKGSTRWRGLKIEVLDFIPEAVAEEVIEDRGVQVNNPALRVELLEGEEPRRMTLYAYSHPPTVLHDLGLGFSYVRTGSERDADRAARRDPDGDPEKLIAMRQGAGRADEVELDYGREKVGSTVSLRNLGVRLKVHRWFSGSRLGQDGTPVRALPYRRFPPAIEMEPLGPDRKAQPRFWIVGGQLPRKPIGAVPAPLKGLSFLYDPPRWQPLEVRIVEGPEGSFRLVELVDGKLAKIRPVAIGETLDIEGGRRVRVAAFIRGAARSYRPVMPSEGQASEPAVQLAVARGAVRETFWYFPRRSRARGVFDANLLVRGVRRGLEREAVRVEVRAEGSAPETVTVEQGKPLSLAGYDVHLRNVTVTGRRKGQKLGLVDFTVSRKPAMWLVYLGMALMALGVPWLLWSRFRHVPDPVEDA